MAEDRVKSGSFFLLKYDWQGNLTETAQPPEYSGNYRETSSHCWLADGGVVFRDDTHTSIANPMWELVHIAPDGQEYTTAFPINFQKNRKTPSGGDRPFDGISSGRSFFVQYVYSTALNAET